MNAPRVVNLMKSSYDVYCGRTCRGHKAETDSRGRNIYANPYKIGRDGDRAHVIALHMALWRLRFAGRRRAFWIGKLQALDGKALGCWCAPQACHCDNYVRLFEEFFMRKGTE